MTVLNAPTQALAAGDRTPNFVLPDASGKFSMFYDRVTGRPTVLLVAPSFHPPVLPSALLGFESAAEKFDAMGVDIFCVSMAGKEAVEGCSPKMHLWADPEHKISQALLQQLGFSGPKPLSGGKVVAALLDSNQRLLAMMDGDNGELSERVLAFYSSRPALPPAQVRHATAPVLIMPDLLDPAMCKALIDRFESGQVEEGAVGSVIAGKEVERLHHERKKRLDHKIEDAETNKVLQQIIGRRVMPELSKSSHFGGFRFDRFLVCRYAADREDRFRTHRDNVSPETADRKFAMTLNLNGDEYEGGELVFPEYGPDRYKPGNGGAVIFSCSLLHEALPVTKGVRYALLTFLRQPQPQQAQKRPIPALARR